MTRLAAIVCLAFALTGCGSGSNDNEAAAPSTTSTSPTTTSTSPPSMQTVPDCMPSPSASTSPQKSSANANRETMYLESVTTGADECTAKVLFGFEEQAPGPGFEVSYQPADTAKIEDASGNPIEIDGDAFLVVKLNPAMTAKIDGDQVTKTYNGPRRISGSDPITEVVKTGDFEGVVTWVIGLDSKRSFTTNASESQLAIEIDRS
jgi:hypothetical protein